MSYPSLTAQMSAVSLPFLPVGVSSPSSSCSDGPSSSYAYSIIHTHHMLHRHKHVRRVKYVLFVFSKNLTHRRRKNRPTPRRDAQSHLCNLAHSDFSFFPLATTLPRLRLISSMRPDRVTCASSEPAKPFVISRVSGRPAAGRLPPTRLRQGHPALYRSTPPRLRSCANQRRGACRTGRPRCAGHEPRACPFAQGGANLCSYIQAFSADVHDIFERFAFSAQVDRLSKAGPRDLVAQKFNQINLHPGHVDNHQMGLVFEELTRRIAELANETAGENFTPCKANHQMVNLLFVLDDDVLSKPGVVRTICDPMAGEHLCDHCDKASLVIRGHELNPEPYAICSSWRQLL